MAKNTDSTPKRLVRMRLSADLIEVIEEIGEPYHRTTTNAIDCVLLWAAWSYLNGRNPESEMAGGNYGRCQEMIRERRQRQSASVLKFRTAARASE